jgi:hypothetical protein
MVEKLNHLLKDTKELVASVTRYSVFKLTQSGLNSKTSRPNGWENLQEKTQEKLLFLGVGLRLMSIKQDIFKR